MENKDFVGVTAEGVKAPSEIVFHPNEKKSNWIMKLTPEGIIFNREVYPNYKPDDFAQSVIDILENCFELIFTKKEPPYIKQGLKIRQPKHKEDETH